MSETSATTLGQFRAARLADYWELTKPGIAGAVLMTSVSGFLVGGGLSHPDGWLRLVHMVFGTALTAFGAGLAWGSLVLDWTLEAPPARQPEEPTRSALPIVRSLIDGSLWDGLPIGPPAPVSPAAAGALDAAAKAAVEVAIEPAAPGASGD